MDNDTTTQTQPNPAPAVPADPRPLLTSAANAAMDVIGSVTDDQRSRPTPCAAFDVATLLDHLSLVASRITSLGRGEPDYSVEDGGTTGWPVDQIAFAFGNDIAEAEAAWADPETLTRSLTLPWATMPGAAVLTMYVSELTVHTWDLAVATGQTPTWDAEVVETSLAFMKDALPAEIRPVDGGDEVPFGPVVDTPADAAPIDQLVAWTGRRPVWL
jgi:uncharacterized protein (TIGR03086 family)